VIAPDARRVIFSSLVRGMDDGIAARESKHLEAGTTDYSALVEQCYPRPAPAHICAAVSRVHRPPYYLHSMHHYIYLQIQHEYESVSEK
jgi:hypothetical protein